MTLGYAQMVDGLPAHAQIAPCRGGYLVALHTFGVDENDWDTEYHVFTDLESAVRIMASHIEKSESVDQGEIEKRLKSARRNRR